MKSISIARTFLILGAVNAFLCVALGAFGAHGLRQILAMEMLTIYHTGVQYHFNHAIGLIIVGLVLRQYPNIGAIIFSGWLMLAGIILFSVSLYIYSLTGMRGLSMITPFGGVAFLAAWVLLAIGIWQQK